MEPITFGLTDAQPGQQLAQFVRQLRALLLFLVNDEDCSNLFYSEMLPGMREAWPEVEPRFEPYANRVSDANPELLAHHGLTGGQLRFKFNAVNFIASRFFEHFFSGNEISMARKWLKKLLEIIDKLFRSLLAAVPGGGAIEEYKDIAESLVPNDD